MRVELTQFLRPSGHTRSVFCEVADDLKPQLELIEKCGLRFTCESIYGNYSLCLEHPSYGEFDIEIAANKPGEHNRKVLEGMIGRFDESKYHAWYAEFQG